MNNCHKMLISEGPYAAEIEYREIDDKSGFGPLVAKEDALKMDRVRLALRRGDLVAAARDAKIFEMHPVAAE